MNAIVIRRATPADGPALAHLAASAFRAKFGHLYPAPVLEAYLRDTYAEPRTAALLADPALTVWVAEQSAALAAFAVLGPAALPHPAITQACIELRRLYTAPDRVGAGLGTQMMDAAILPAIAAAAARGGDAWVGVYSDNDGAQRFYARYGFTKAGEYEFPVGPVRDREFILRRPARIIPP